MYSVFQILYCSPAVWLMRRVYFNIEIRPGAALIKKWHSEAGRLDLKQGEDSSNFLSFTLSVGTKVHFLKDTAHMNPPLSSCYHLGISTTHRIKSEVITPFIRAACP